MPKTEYRLFHQRTAEKIRDEISRLRDSLLFGSKKKVHKFGKVNITCDIATLEILLSDYILDYENSEESDRQLTTRQEWHDFLTKTEFLSYNECLLILLGISPTLADLLESKLYKINLINEGDLHGEPLSLIFFQRVENHLLRDRFGTKKINTQELIDWALKNRLLRENVDEV
jgi:hypothetical protein